MNAANPPLTRISLPAIAILLAALLLTSTGCARYQLGRHGEPPFRSVHVQPVKNESFAPQIHALLSGKIAEEIARDGAVRVSGQTEADATLEVVVRDFTRDISARRAEDTAIAAKLDIELVALCTLTDNRTGEVYFSNRQVSATSHYYPREIGDEPENPRLSERQTMPILAADMARDIGRTVLQTW